MLGQCGSRSLTCIKRFVRRTDGYAYKVAAAGTAWRDSNLTGRSGTFQVRLNELFRSRPRSLALASDSPLRIEDPEFQGIRRVILRMLLFYSKASRSIRRANVVYSRVVSQVDKPVIYTLFNLERNSKSSFSLLVLHMWLFLRRLKQEGQEGVSFGQYVYEIYNHDLELRVSKAGAMSLMLNKWMRDLEKVFYGNIIAYDDAMLPEANPDYLPAVLWKNVFSENGLSSPDDSAKPVLEAMARYVRREAASLNLTDKEAILSGNFAFTSLAA